MQNCVNVRQHSLPSLGPLWSQPRELPDGYAFRVPGDKKWIAVVAELIVAEHECCPFLTFELAAEPNTGPVIVRVIGPAGTKDFLKTMLCKAEGSI
jgi:hypothetical protein